MAGIRGPRQFLSQRQALVNRLNVVERGETNERTSDPRLPLHFVPDGDDLVLGGTLVLGEVDGFVVVGLSDCVPVNRRLRDDAAPINMLFDDDSEHPPSIVVMLGHLVSLPNGHDAIDDAAVCAARALVLNQMIILRRPS